MQIPKLLDEQERDAQILAQRDGAADWSEAGAVKTLTALRAVELRGGVSEKSPLLVVASPIALRMWTQVAPAFFRHAAPSVLRIASSKDAKHLDKTITVVSYNLLSRNAELAARLAKRRYGAIILDEAHALVSLDAARTRAVYGKRAVDGGIIRSADFRLALTGTPIPRYADGLFPVLKALGPDILDFLGASSEEAFLKRFTYRQMKSYHPRQRPKPVVIRSINTDELSDAVFDPIPGNATPFAVRRFVDEIDSSLPPLTETDLEIEYVNSQELDEATQAIEYPELYEAQTVATATVRRLLGLAKVPATMPVVTELRKAYKSPVILFFWHTEVGNLLHQMLQQEGYRSAVLDGSTPVAKKGVIEDTWNAGGYDFLIGQIAAMGESLNLQKGGHVAAFVEHDWSRARHEQAWKRVRRFGQQRRVQVFNLYADHPADDAAANVAERKATYAAEILDKRKEGHG